MTPTLLLLEYQSSGPSQRKPTPEETSQRKPEILEAIGEHLREFGRKNWDRVRERPDFAPHVGRQAGEAGRRKFFRWVEDVVRVTPKDTTRPHEARAAAEKHMTWAEAIAAEARVEHPDIDVPVAFIARQGADGRPRINIEALARQTLEDIGRQRQAAFVKDPSAPGGERLQDVELLDKSIARSIRFLDTYVRVGDLVWEIESRERRYHAFVDLMIEELPGDKILPAMKRLKERIDQQAQFGVADDGLRTSPSGKVTPSASLDDVPTGPADVPASPPVQ